MLMKGEMSMNKLMCMMMAGAVGFGCLNGYSKTLVDLPVSAVGNTAYLTSAPERPWWNKSWTRRAPILVSSASQVASGKTVVETVVDFGEKVNPEEVRVVTPWETEIPCWAEAADGTAIRLFFKTPLRIEENKPFLVYWGNPQAKRAKVKSYLTLNQDDEELTLANGVLEVVFDRVHATAGLLKVLRVLASQTPNELQVRATGYAWQGFSLQAGGPVKWGAFEVVEDNPFVKRVRVDGDKATVEFSLYEGQPRIDYAYTLKNGRNEAWLYISWSCGDGVGQDDLYYPSLTGKTLSLRAALDTATDCIKNPEYRDLQRFLGAGWYAIRDRVQKEVVAHLFDRSKLLEFHYEGAGQHAGEAAQLHFRHALKKGETARGAGALFATLGDLNEVKEEYARTLRAPQVFVGASEAVREIAVKRPQFHRDFCADFNIGKGSGAGWASGEPLEGTAWCSNIVDHLRSYGANAVRIGGYGWKDLPVSKELYGRIAAFEGKKENMQRGAKTYPPWEEGVYTGRKFREHTAAAHAKGMSVSLWSSYLGEGWLHSKEAVLSAEGVTIDLDVMCLYADCGADLIFNGWAVREGHHAPESVMKGRGRNYWQWDDPTDFFELYEKPRTERINWFGREAKKRYPHLPVVTMNSECSILERETMMTDQTEGIDVVYCEFLPQCDSPRTVPHSKQSIKRLHALNNNAVGRTAHNHFYYYSHDTWNRIVQVDMPFAFGCCGFSFENLTYENFGFEQPQIVADSYRFFEYTRLGDKVARMGTVKDLAVYRSNRAYVDDVKAKRRGKPYAYTTQQDGRANGVAEIRNLNYDIVIDPYFTAKSLAAYRVVFVPENRSFTEGEVKELLAYAQAGGGALVEGASGDALKKRLAALEPGKVLAHGKGKVLWIANEKDDRTLTDRLATGWDMQAQAAFKAAIASVGSRPPYTVEGSKTLDSMLQASDEGLFFGIYNDGKSEDKGIVTIDAQVLTAASPLYVLDVKKGVRVPFTNGFEIVAEPQQASYCLIGDDTFTALLKVKDGTWAGLALTPASAADVMPGAKLPEDKDLPAGIPYKVIEIVDRSKLIRRSFEAAFNVAQYHAKNYDRLHFATDLKDAKYIFFHGYYENQRDAFVEKLFEDNAAELRDFLARGGGLIFHMSVPGPKAKKFLADAGVVDPSDTLTDDTGDGKGVWNPSVSTNTLLCAKAGSWFNANLGSNKGYAKWTKDQYAPFVMNRKRDVAMVVAQENVLGKGKVLFTRCSFAFTDWYENMNYGDAIVSWMIGMPAKDHAAAVERKNGGPGKIVE